MKKLYEYIKESVLGSDIETEINNIATKDYINKHFNELFAPSFSGSGAVWKANGIDCTNADVNWLKIIELWKRGIEVPIINAGTFDNEFFYKGLNSLPKDSADFDLFVNEILAKAKIERLIWHTYVSIDSNMKKLLLHPGGIDHLCINLKDRDKSLSDIPFNKIKAKYIKISHDDAYRCTDVPSIPMLDYKSITGWKGSRLTVDFSFGLVNLDRWLQGEDRVVDFYDANKEALDYLFSKNNFKEIMVNCMHMYKGSNRKCSGRPYYAYIAKSGSEYTYKLK